MKLRALQDGRVNLTTLRTPISNGALSSEQLPTRIKLLNWGDNPSVKGVVRVDAGTVQALERNQSARGFKEVALDYEHSTVPGSREFERTREPRPVAGYGVPVVVPGEGLYLDQVRWTPSGVESARNYADLSPAVETAEDGRVVFVHSAALVRNGAVEGLTFYSVEIGETNCGEKMSERTFLTLSAVAAAVGLGATATEAEVCEKLKTLSAPTVVDMKPLEERITALSADVKKLQEELAAGATAQAEAEKTKVIALFGAEGKVPKKADGAAYTAEELKALDLPTLKLLHVNTPATVSLSASGKAREGKSREGLKGLALAIAAHKGQ